MWKKLQKLLVLSLFLTACAPFGTHEPGLAERVERQDIQIRQMQPQQADTMNQIEAMKQEIAELRGQLDNLNRSGAPGPLADGTRLGDSPPGADNGLALNTPLGEAANNGSMATLPAVPVTATPPIASGQGAPDSSAYGTARAINPVPMTGSQSASYGLPPETQSTIVQPAQGPSESTWGQADPQPQPQLQVPKKDISLALFDAGVNSFNSRDYAAAEKSFDDFIKNYPDHSQSAEARFYLAECQFNRNRFPEAALAYETVIKKYPKSSSAPGAYLKQAISFSKMKQTAAAKARMQEVINKFPNSPEAARAKAFLKTNK